MPQAAIEHPSPQSDDNVITLSLKGDPRELGLTHLDQYFGPWAVCEQRFLPMIQSLDRMDLRAHIEASRGSSESSNGYSITAGGVALIELSGTMTKRGSSFSGGGTMQVRRKLRLASQDSAVSAVMLKIESPGGAVSGTKELADDVAAAAASKPLHAFIEDIGASAAYYVASQAAKISANAPAFVGSIGTFMVIYDASRAYDNAGIKVHVIRSGAMKGAGTPGTTVTDEQLASWQELIAKSNELFLDAVKRGRRMDEAQLKQLATGQVWLAQDALSKGLIDEVSTFDAALQSLEAEVSSRPKGRPKMSDNNPEVKAATIAELEAACPGASADFLLAQVKRGATVETAQREYISCQAAELKAAKAAQAKAEEEAATARKQAETLPGNPPVSGDNTQSESWYGGSATSAWKKLVAEAKQAGLSAQDATIRVDLANPGLRDAMLAESATR